jgi:hypothetical protein
MNGWPPEKQSQSLATIALLLLLLTWESVAPFFLQFARFAG